MSDRMLRQLILDLLVDCPGAPFALTYYEMREELGDAPDVRTVFNEIERMVADGLLLESVLEDGGERTPDPTERTALLQHYESWLPTEFDSGSMAGHVEGLWYTMTPAGRAEWRANVPNDYVDPPRWQIAEEPVAAPNIVTICAESLAVAEEAMQQWSTLTPGWEVEPASRRVEPLPVYLYNGRSIRDGVKVTFRKRRRSNWTH